MSEILLYNVSGTETEEFSLNQSSLERKLEEPGDGADKAWRHSRETGRMSQVLIPLDQQESASLALTQPSSPCLTNTAADILDIGDL